MQTLTHFSQLNLEMHRLSGQGPESDDFPCDQPGPVMGRSASPLANSEPARVDVTSALTSACKRVAGVEVLHCE